MQFANKHTFIIIAYILFHPNLVERVHILFCEKYYGEIDGRVHEVNCRFFFHYCLSFFSIHRRTAAFKHKRNLELKKYITGENNQKERPAILSLYIKTKNG